MTGAGGPAAINFVRSIREAEGRLKPGEKIFILGTDINKYRIHLSPANETVLVPRCTDPSYPEFLRLVVKENDIDLIHPQPDIEVKYLGSNYRTLFEPYLFLPRAHAISVAQSKWWSFLCWRRNNVPTAETILIEEDRDIDRAIREFGTPIWIRASSGAGGKGSTPCETARTALAWMDYWNSRGRNMTFLAQEYLPGRNYGWHSLWKDGELITSMARERLEYIYPYLSPSGITGTPTVQVTVHDDEINKVGELAVKAVDKHYTGIACVDLKGDGEGLPRVTEINPGRMFTTSWFFSFLGDKLWSRSPSDYPEPWFANFPYLYARLALGRKLPNDLPKYNILPEGWYWIRHLDGLPVVKHEKEICTRI